MVALNPANVAKIVQDTLRTKQPEGPRVRVDAEHVKLDSSGEGWWFVPVSYYLGDGREWAYYEMFSRVEDEIESQHGIDVFLVPRPLAPRDPDSI